MKIAIIDYGMGNIHSVAKALELSGARAVVTNKKSEIESADKLVLPGVGAFDDAIEELIKQGLVAIIKEQVNKGKPFLGICLGLQLLLEESQEAKKNKGLGLLEGKVVKFSAKSGQKIPHMGWNNLKVLAQDCALLDGVINSPQVYFCHSYYPDPALKSVIAATTDYGLEFPCVLSKDNIFGVQFHPEKSQAVGQRIIKNFVEKC
ncbi:MAG: imidazole glycerol phosphate synthase subunit HisH [Candidatus Omnitrophica bacterium]|jgi:glutamine amidotransferase|nr:imidazole glycerol phosphate synthase subunit HisH [Candidatus Omnitrophota bacterium]